MDEAISIAFREDDEVLVEEFLLGDEIGCGVYLYDDVVIPLPLTEIVSKTEFFDYQAKYLGASDEITLARIRQKKPRSASCCRPSSIASLTARGWYVLTNILREGTFYFLEVNPSPALARPASCHNKSGIWVKKSLKCIAS
ncbi:MAG: hypothetical protein U5L09_22905 [Bacteroidales bacterium]|nr:hypothetical protein [Bacteroidales bacterium]